MIRRFVFLIILIAYIFLLTSCITQSGGTDIPPSDAENPSDKIEMTTVECGYLKSGEDSEYLSYKLAYKVAKSKQYNQDERIVAKIRMSHGSNGGWYSGGYIYPEISRIDVLFEESVLVTLKYFTYLDRYVYYETERDEYSEYWYTSDYCQMHEKYYADIGKDSAPLIYFDNEVEYYIPLIEGKEEYAFQIREIYSDGTVNIAAEAKLYARFEDGTVYFSAEPFEGGE